MSHHGKQLGANVLIALSLFFGLRHALGSFDALSLAAGLLVLLTIKIDPEGPIFVRDQPPAPDPGLVVLTMRTSERWPTSAELQVRETIEEALVRGGLVLDGHDAGDGSMAIVVMLATKGGPS